jgi:hypothetical protein
MRYVVRAADELPVPVHPGRHPEDDLQRGIRESGD